MLAIYLSIVSFLFLWILRSSSSTIVASRLLSLWRGLWVTFLCFCFFVFCFLFGFFVLFFVLFFCFLFVPLLCVWLVLTAILWRWISSSSSSSSSSSHTDMQRVGYQISANPCEGLLEEGLTCWSDLITDALEHITSFLCLPDHHRFSAVCKNWRSVAKQKRHSPAPQLPWLVLREDNVTKKRIFYSLSEKKHYAVDIPELYGCFVAGSSHGWLIAVDIKITGILINPFTREFYELPPFPHYGEGLIDYNNPFTRETLQYKLISKAILSHDPKVRPDFTVMILVGVRNRPAFWKPGNSSWSEITFSGPRMKDVIYCKGQFYFANCQNQIFALDFEPHPKLTLVVLRRPIAQCYLVDYYGVLLLVERLHRQIEKHHYRTYRFHVIRPDLEKEKVAWQSGIGDHALFLGRSSHILIDPNNFPGSGCKSNSIYFTPTNEPLTAEIFGCDDLGIFNMGDKTVTTFYPPEIFHPHLYSPIWFIPNPW